MPIGTELLGIDPGLLTSDTDQQSDLVWKGGEHNNLVFQNQRVSGAARDAGNTPTTLLRNGLLLGQVTSSLEVKEWNPTGTDGSEFIRGLLIAPGGHNTQLNSADKDKTSQVLVRGLVKAAKIIVPGGDAGISGDALEHIIRVQLGLLGFRLDDEITSAAAAYGHAGNYSNIIAKTADFTVLESQNGALFTTEGAAAAVEFTLPSTAKKGLRYTFFASEDFDLKVTAGTADTLIVFNDVAADSVSFETASEIVGGAFEVVGDGAKWIVMPRLGQDSQTVTVAT